MTHKVLQVIVIVVARALVDCSTLSASEINSRIQRREIETSLKSQAETMPQMDLDPEEDQADKKYWAHVFDHVSYYDCQWLCDLALEAEKRAVRNQQQAARTRFASINAWAKKISCTK